MDKNLAIETAQNEQLYIVMLTYRPTEEPPDCESAVKILKRFINKVKKYRQKKNLPSAQYFAFTQKSKGGHWRHNILFDDSTELKEICAMWDKGIWKCTNNLSPSLKSEAISYFSKERECKKNKGKV